MYWASARAPCSGANSALSRTPGAAASRSARCRSRESTLLGLTIAPIDRPRNALKSSATQRSSPVRTMGPHLPSAAPSFWLAVRQFGGRRARLELAARLQIVELTVQVAAAQRHLAHAALEPEQQFLGEALPIHECLHLGSILPLLHR